MKSKFLKLFSGFLTITLLFGQIGNVSAYDETINLSTDIDGHQQGKITDENYVILTDDLAVESAKVYQQYVKLTQEEYEAINRKIESNLEYSKENQDITPEVKAQKEQNNADLNKMIPIFDNTKWNELTLTQKNAVITRTDNDGKEININGNKYNVPLPENLAYMVSWTKVTIGDTDYYQFFLYCYIETETVTYKCEIKDGKYYDSEGKETTKEKYEEDCLIKSCSIKDGKYYGKDAEEVTKEVYEKECGNYCKIVNDKYYNDKGEEVTKAEYEKACGNPKTGITNYYLIGGSFIVLAGLGYTLIKNKKLFSK